MDKITLQTCIKKIKQPNTYQKDISRQPQHISQEDVQTTFTFNMSKTYQKEISRRPRYIFFFQNYIKRVRQSYVKFWFIKIASKKWIETT